MRVRFPLAWIIKQQKKLINVLIKEKSYFLLNSTNQPKFFYAFHFSSIFYPGSLKNINLFLRSAMHNTNLSSCKNGTFRNNKIILKQSYLLITWIHYLCKSKEDLNYSITAQHIKKPSFFVHPYSQSKITLIKSPLAHKTFSQEQFLTRYYGISVSFQPNTTLSTHDIIDSVNGSIYSSSFIRDNVPLLSTNLLFLKRMSYFYNSSDLVFYSYYFFKNNNTRNKAL